MKIERAYFDRDVEALRRSFGVSEAVADVLALHWSGKLLAAGNLATELLARAGEIPAPLLWAEHALITVKLGKSLPEGAPLSVLRDPTASTVYEYARFHSLFFANHAEAIRSLLRLLLLGLRAPATGLVALVGYNVGHMLALRGWRRLGFPIARFFFWRTARRTQKRGKTRFADNVVLATFLYSVVVSARLDLIETVTRQTQAVLPTDPYYEVLFLVSSLYAAAYSGNHARAEVVSAHFRQLHEGGALLRYKPVAEIMPLVPLALRGYGHLVRNEFAAVVARHEAAVPNVGHAIDSAFFRAAAIVALSIGQYEEARSFIARAIDARQMSKSFQAWRRIDARILDMAERHVTFGDAGPELFGVDLRAETPLTLGTLLLELVTALPSSLSGGSRAFEDRAFALLKRHLECPDAVVREAPAALAENKPQIRVGARYLVLVGVSEERIPAVDAVLASVGPVLAILEQSTRDMMALKEENDRIAREIAIARTTQMLAHDVRRPFQLLNAVLMALRPVRAPEDIERVVRELLPEVERAAKSVDLLIADAMNIDDRASSRPVATPFEEIVGESLRDVFAARTDCDVHLGYEIPAPIALSVDPIRMRRVFANVIGNAVEAMQGRGRIWIRVAEAEEAGFAAVTIGNSGPPLPEAGKGRLFDAFYSEGKPGGTGLGLTIAHRVVVAHGGVIRCTNVEGGVEFVLTLPATSLVPDVATGRATLPHHSGALEVGRQSPVPAAPAIAGEVDLPEIVVVDDSRAIHAAWRAAMNERATVRYFRSPAQFWGAVDADPPMLDRARAVITDYRFDDREECGSSLALGLRQRRPELPVFVSSSGILKDVEVDGIFDGVLEKLGIPWPDLAARIAIARGRSLPIEDERKTS